MDDLIASGPDRRPVDDTPPFRVSMKTRQQGGSFEAIRSFWQLADAIEEFDAAWVYDHFLPIFSEEPAPVLEGWSLLSALAASTRRLRLGVLVTGNTYRHPALLAKIAASVDHISEGRLELALGAGWNEDEHNRFGLCLPPLQERMDRLDDACEVITGMLARPDGATVRTRHYEVRDAILDPRPVQARIPFVIGGRGERRTLRSAAMWADGWNLPAGEPQILSRKLDVLAAHCRDVGRDVSEIEVSVQVPVREDPAASVRWAEAMRAAGANHVVFLFDAPYDEHALAELADAVDAANLKR